MIGVFDLASNVSEGDDINKVINLFINMSYRQVFEIRLLYLTAPVVNESDLYVKIAGS